MRNVQFVGGTMTNLIYPLIIAIIFIILWLITNHIDYKIDSGVKKLERILYKEDKKK